MRNAPLIVAGGLVLAACNGDGTGSNGDDYAGFLYTSTNNTAGNAIVALGRGSDGRVRELRGSPYATGGSGDAADGRLRHAVGAEDGGRLPAGGERRERTRPTAASPCSAWTGQDGRAWSG
jgi:hypothetical protein